MSTWALVALAAARLEAGPGAVRQGEELKIPACWLEWEEPAAFWWYKTAAGGSRTASLSLAHLVALPVHSGLQPAWKFNGQDDPKGPRARLGEQGHPLEFGGYADPRTCRCFFCYRCSRLKWDPKSAKNENRRSNLRLGAAPIEATGQRESS